jgi:hypothetical protein
LALTARASAVLVAVQALKDTLAQQVARAVLAVQEEL